MFMCNVDIFCVGDKFLYTHQSDFYRVVCPHQKAAQDDGSWRGGVGVAISPSRPQTLAHHLDAGALRQPGAVQDECKSGAAIVQFGLVGNTVLGARVDPRGNVLSLLAQQATLSPRIAGRRQAPVQGSGDAHLQEHHHKGHPQDTMKDRSLSWKTQGKKCQQ